jgi:hypothetical protein
MVVAESSNSESSHDAGTSQRQMALEVCRSFEQVDASVLLVIERIFSSEVDRRAINGFQFLAHFLRLAQIMQLALFPGCDVAVVSFKSVWDLCTTPSYAWPYSYDATSKYLRLLCALGIFSKPRRSKHDPVIYQFPLRPYQAPIGVDAALTQLSGARNKKVSKSLALQRMINADSTSGKSSRSQRLVGDSSRSDFDQRLKEAAIAVRDALAEKGIAVPAAALQQITAALSEVLLPERSGFGTERQSRGGDSPLVESATLPQADAQRFCSDKQICTEESASLPKNLPCDPKLADSVVSAHTEFNISNSNLSLRENEITEFNGVPVHESAISGQRSADSKPVDEHEASLSSSLDAVQIQHDAADLSYLFEKNDSSVGHYTKLLREDHHALRLAAIDAWIRSSWPDRGYKRMKLGGAWVTRQYRAYRAGMVPPPEILAWAQTDYSYFQIKMALSAIDHSQQKTLRPAVRPWPSEVIMPVSEIEDPSFWLYGAAHDLEVRGYLYVDMEGDLVPASRYEQLRLQVVLEWSRDLAEVPPSTLDDELEHTRQEEAFIRMREEVEAYLTWVQPQVCQPEPVSPSCQLSAQFVEDIEQVKAGLDPSLYEVQPLIIPLTGHLLICVQGIGDPEQRWLLSGPEDTQAFIAACLETQSEPS